MTTHKCYYLLFKKNGLRQLHLFAESLSKVGNYSAKKGLFLPSQRTVGGFSLLMLDDLFTRLGL